MHAMPGAMQRGRAHGPQRADADAHRRVAGHLQGTVETPAVRLDGDAEALGCMRVGMPLQVAQAEHVAIVLGERGQDVLDQHPRLQALPVLALVAHRLAGGTTLALVAGGMAIGDLQRRPPGPAQDDGARVGGEQLAVAGAHAQDDLQQRALHGVLGQRTITEDARGVGDGGVTMLTDQRVDALRVAMARVFTVERRRGVCAVEHPATPFLVVPEITRRSANPTV